ncbi:MAG TPA: COG1361 S-layer family protein [Candidatus Methanoperedens sp.]
MKRTMLPVLIILLMMAYTPAVNAALSGSTVLAVSIANYDPNPAIAGDPVEVRIGIENTGGITTNNLMLEVVPEYPFELVPGENAVHNVGIIPEYQADSTANIKIVTYKMQINKNSPAGSYELKVKYYEAGSIDMSTKSLSLDVKSRETAQVIHLDQSILVPGKQSSLKFTINNLGNAPLRDLTFNWDNDQNIILPVGSDNTRYIKYIDIGNGTDLEYQVIADTNAQPGLYKLNLHLSYGDSFSNKTNTINTFAGMYVGGGTDFDTAFSDSSNGQMSFSVANIGSNPANSVSVTIPEQRGWSVTGSNSVIIGNLNKGDYTVASFKLQSSMSNMSFPSRGARNNSNSNSNSNIQGEGWQRSMNGSTSNSPGTVLMQIAYTDTTGERKVVEKQVKLGSQNVGDGLTVSQGRRGAVPQASVFSTYMWYFIGMGVLLVGFAGYRKYTTHKLIDPDFKMKDLFKSQKK